jgi:dipeptidyl aminopeptidase/acylaminoacyl peptidase
VRRSGTAGRDGPGSGLRRPLAALVFAAALAHAGEPAVVPPPGLKLEGVPPIPAKIADDLAPYAEFRPHALLSWHPIRREMLVRRRLHETAQVHRVAEPGVAPVPLTDFDEPVRDAEYSPGKGDAFSFTRAEGGNEAYRLYLQDLRTGAVTAVSREGERVSDVAWNRKCDRIAYAGQAIDRSNPERRARTVIHVTDPRRPASDRAVARLEGGGWSDLRFSEDGKRLALVEYVSANESSIWVLDLASGARRRVTPPGPKADPVAYAKPQFTSDGRALFATSDRGSEFRQLVRIPIAGGRERVLTGHIAHDVDDFDVSYDAKRIAFTTNEDGADVLRFIDLATLKEVPRPPLVAGVIGGLRWRPHSQEVGFQIASARSAGDVFSYDVAKNQLARWTNGNSRSINTSAFPEPRTFRWKSFDGREIPGLLYLPPARFTGKRPVLVSIHGGPESQARPGFLGRNNHLVNEMGIAIVYPNVRGSSGFGKSFLRLDDGPRRVGAIEDIGALLDWIGTQPDLDPKRVAIAGASYGAFLALACAERYADRIAAAESVVGISRFVTFLERTESYRRDLRRAEYGDERDPAARAFLESISPLAHAERITKPLLVAQGANDPRVPPSEAEQLVAALKSRGTPVWFLLAADEGHGFARRSNADFLFYARVEFLRKNLLR